MARVSKAVGRFQRRARARSGGAVDPRDHSRSPPDLAIQSVALSRGRCDIGRRGIVHGCVSDGAANADRGGPDIDMRFAVNNPTVISETIEGETIIIHLGTGTYYSLEGTGADVWAALERSATAKEIAEQLEARYDVAGDSALSAVEAVLAEMASEELVRAADGEVVATEAVTSLHERGEFTPPKLAKYTDMQDIILLDPVHEVDERGWPHATAQGA